MTEREVEREFWAGVLGTKVEKDGSVPGFSEWWGNQNPRLARIGLRIGRETARHVAKGAPAGEAIATAVTMFKQSIVQFQDPETLSTERWSAFGAEILKMVQERGWKPPQVLAALEEARPAVLQDGPIDLWIDELRAYGSEWPIQRLERAWAMPDGRTVEFRFPS